jgi:integrase/recombinase XerD
MATAKSLTTADIEKVLDYIAVNQNPIRNRAMFMMGLLAGLRCNEIAGLTVGDVMNKDGTVKGEIYLSAQRTKHNHARTVFVSSRLQSELATYIATKSIYSDTQPLFSVHHSLRKAFSANTMTQYFYWLFRKNNVAHGSSHSLRKTFLSSLANQGVSVFVLASLAGHRSISTTQRYITVNDDIKRRAVELV